jgi:hypothetical protein
MIKTVNCTMANANFIENQDQTAWKLYTKTFFTAT